MLFYSCMFYIIIKLMQCKAKNMYFKKKAETIFYIYFEGFTSLRSEDGFYKTEPVNKTSKLQDWFLGIKLAPPPGIRYH